jgi:AcrR family transcriptional regulator
MEKKKKIFTKNTPTGKASKETILLGALKLFLTKPYEMVTVTALENTTKKSRGAIFYHIKDMRELLEILSKKYFDNIQGVQSWVTEDFLKKDISLLEFIDMYIAELDKKISFLYDVSKIDKHSTKISRFYLSLSLNIGYYLKDHNKKMYNNIQKEKEAWAYIIQKAIERGEVKPNINAKLLGELFTSIFLGKLYHEAFKNGMDTKELKELFMDAYEQIKL